MAQKRYTARVLHRGMAERLQTQCRRANPPPGNKACGTRSQWVKNEGNQLSWDAAYPVCVRDGATNHTLPCQFECLMLNYERRTTGDKDQTTNS